MITNQTKIHLEKKLDVTDLSGEKVMIDFETGKYFLLKGSANEIWEYIEQDITVEEIVEKLMTVYEVDRQTCEASVIQFLTQLEENGFIVANS